MEEGTLTSRKGATWGSEATSARRGAPGVLILLPLCWGLGSHYFGGRNGSPSERSLRGDGSATLAVSNPRPSQFLRTPQRGRTAVPLRLLPAAHAQLFVCCWTFSLSRKKRKRNRQEDGAEEGEAPVRKHCTFAAVHGGRAGLLSAGAAKPGASCFRLWGSGGARGEGGRVPRRAAGKGTVDAWPAPGGPGTPRLPGRAGWAHAGESLVLVRAGRDHGAGPVGGSWPGARRGHSPTPYGLPPRPQRLADGTELNMAAGGPPVAGGAGRG